MVLRGVLKSERACDISNSFPDGARLEYMINFD